MKEKKIHPVKILSNGIIILPLSIPMKLVFDLAERFNLKVRIVNEFNIYVLSREEIEILDPFIVENIRNFEEIIDMVEGKS